MSDWQPKVGDECLCHIRGGKTCDKIYKRGFISFIGAKYVVFTDKNGREYSRRKNKVDIKPLPTEEEKLINELQQLDNVYHDQSDYYPIMAKSLIKVGYRKVEPISYFDFHDSYVMSYRNTEVLFNYLAKNNHIVVKGE